MPASQATAAPRRFIIICRSRELASQIEDQLLMSGFSIACYGAGGPEQAQSLARATQPEVALMESGLNIAPPSGARVVHFDPARFDPAEVARRIADPEPASAVPCAPPPTPSLTWRTALGFVGMAGGVGTTTLVCALALAAARRGENALVVDMAGGDCLPTFGGELRRETAAWSVRKKEYGERLGVIVASSLSRIERQPDVLLVDAGSLREMARADALTRSGITLFYVVPHDLDAAGLTHPTKERRLVNKASKAGEGRIPFDEALTARINAGRFEPEDTDFMRACAAWLDARLLR